MQTFVIRCLAALCLSSLLAAVPTWAQVEEPPNVPNFWDPRTRIEPPKPGSLKSIRFLTVERNFPFSFRDRRGVLIGFDIDLIRAICDELDVPCAVQYRPFGTLEDALLAGEGDAVIAGLAATEEREERLAFSTSYLKVPGRFVVRAGEETLDPASDLVRRWAGAVCRSAHEAYLRAFFKGVKVACYPTVARGFEALSKGAIDAFFGDGVSLSFRLHDPRGEGCCAFAGGPFVDDRYFGTGYRIAVRVEDRELLRALDYALREIYLSGTYEELYLRYFPVSFY